MFLLSYSAVRCHEINICSFNKHLIFLGAAKMPPFGVGQAIKQAIINFTATNPINLKQIDVVIFEQRMLADFQLALTGSPSSQNATVSVDSTAANMPGSLKSSTSKNGVTVNVLGGDILSSNCDALINTTGKEFDLTSNNHNKINCATCSWRYEQIMS